MAPLGLLASGEEAEVFEINFQNLQKNVENQLQLGSKENRIAEMGLRIGQKIQMLNNEGSGPILLKIDNSRIAIDRGMAMKILVK